MRNDRKKTIPLTEYYTLTEILKLHCQYNVIFGQRSNGKTYAVLCHILDSFRDGMKQGALIRRYLDDIMPSKVGTIFSQIVKNGEISKRWKDWNNVVYRKRRFWLCRDERQDDGSIKRSIDDVPFLFVFALTEEEDYKENSYPDVTTIFFDEFLTRRGYLYQEFVTFMNLVSTIKRQRQDVTIFMVGNTINQYCPYFDEMGIKKAYDIPIGKIEVYTYGQSSLRVAVQRAENLKRKGKTVVDDYFSFDNPRLRMIQAGAWELGIYPHCPYRYRPCEIKFAYFIRFGDELFQCEVVHHDDDWFTFIHRKTTPVKDEKKDLVYQNEPSPKPNVRTTLFKPADETDRMLGWFFLADKVFYQDNEVGNAVDQFRKSGTDIG